MTDLGEEVSWRWRHLWRGQLAELQQLVCHHLAHLRLRGAQQDVHDTLTHVRQTVQVPCRRYTYRRLGTLPVVHVSDDDYIHVQERGQFRPPTERLGPVSVHLPSASDQFCPPTVHLGPVPSTYRAPRTSFCPPTERLGPVNLSTYRAPLAGFGGR